MLDELQSAHRLCLAGTEGGAYFPEHRKNICGWNIRYRERGTRAARANWRGSAGIGDVFPVGSQHRRFRAAMENGRSGGGPDFVGKEGRLTLIATQKALRGAVAP